MVDLTPPPEAPAPDDLSNQVLSKSTRRRRLAATGLPGLRAEETPANRLVRSAGETACPTTTLKKRGAARWGRRFTCPITPANSSRASPCAAPPSPTRNVRRPPARKFVRQHRKHPIASRVRVGRGRRCADRVPRQRLAPASAADLRLWMPPPDADHLADSYSGRIALAIDCAALPWPSQSESSVRKAASRPAARNSMPELFPSGGLRAGPSVAYESLSIASSMRGWIFEAFAMRPSRS